MIELTDMQLRHLKMCKRNMAAQMMRLTLLHFSKIRPLFVDKLVLG